MTGAELIAAERVRQIESEGWTAEHDDSHTRGELSKAADCYLLAATFVVEMGHRPKGEWTPPRLWPWDESWWKPTGDPIRDLTKAGALIAAEIDRLQRANDLTQASPDAELF